MVKDIALHIIRGICFFVALVCAVIFVWSIFPCQPTQKAKVTYNLKTECDKYHLKDTKLIVCQDWDSDSLPAELLYNPNTDVWTLEVK